MWSEGGEAQRDHVICGRASTQLLLLCGSIQATSTKRDERDAVRQGNHRLCPPQHSGSGRVDD